MKPVRLDKFLADSGVGTRSQVKTLLRKGLVTVNGEPLADDSVYHVMVWGSLGFKVNRDFPEAPGSRLIPLEESVPQILQEALSHGGLSEPTPYAVLG